MPQHLSADIICVCQGGPIEKHAALLIASLLENRNIPGEIIAAIPIGSQIQPLSNEMQDFLSYHNIRRVEIVNELDTTYPIAHKIMCCNIDHPSDYLIFVDSDMILLSPLTGYFLIRHQRDFSARLTDFSDLTRDEWHEIYLHCGVSPPAFNLQAWASKESIPLCFNSGLMVMRDPRMLYHTWMKYARQINDPVRFPKTRPFLDQISLVLAIQDLGISYDFLDQREHCSSPIFPIDIQNPPLFIHYYENIHLLGDQVLAPFCTRLIRKYDRLVSILGHEKDLQDLIDN